MKVTRSTKLKDAKVLSAKVAFHLKQGGVETIGDLLNKSDSQLNDIRYIGPAYLKEIQAAKEKLKKML